jgi:excisionase family DNA binding protein
MIDMMEDLLTVEDVANKLNVSEETIKRMLRQKQLPGYKISGQWRISQEDLLKYLAKQKNIQK